MIDRARESRFGDVHRTFSHSINHNHINKELPCSVHLLRQLHISSACGPKLDTLIDKDVDASLPKA